MVNQHTKEAKQNNGYYINDPIVYLKYKYKKDKPQIDLNILIELVKSDKNLLEQVTLEMNERNERLRKKISKQFADYNNSLTPAERSERSLKAAENRDSSLIAFNRWENTPDDVKNTHMDAARFLAYEMFDSRRTSRYEILLEEIPNGWISRREWMDWYVKSDYAKQWGHTTGMFMGALICDDEYFESTGLHNHKKFRKISDNPSDEIMYDYEETYWDIRNNQFDILLNEIPNGWICRHEWMDWFNESSYKKEWGFQNATIISTLIQDVKYFENTQIDGIIRYRKLSDNPSNELMFSVKENKLQKAKREKLERFEILLSEIPNGWISRSEWMNWFKKSKFIKEWGLKSNSCLMSELLSTPKYFETYGNGSDKKYRKLSDNPSDEIMFAPKPKSICTKCGEEHPVAIISRFHNGKCVYNNVMKLYNSLPNVFTLKEAQFMNKELCLPKNISRKLVQDQWLNLIVVNTEGKLGGSPNFLRTYKKL